MCRHTYICPCKCECVHIYVAASFVETYQGSMRKNGERRCKTQVIMCMCIHEYISIFVCVNIYKHMYVCIYVYIETPSVEIYPRYV